MTPFGRICLILAIAAGIPVLPALAQNPPAALVKVDEVREEPLTQTAPVIGRLVARQSGVIAARTAGPVAEVRVEVGDRVDEGDVIAVLSTERILAEVAIRQSAVKIADAKIRTAREETELREQELKRLDRLRKSAAFNQARHDDKRQEVVMAKAELAEALAELRREMANLTLSQIALEDSKIRAPYPGVISQRHTTAGNYLRVGDQVATLVNDEELEIEADIPSARLGGLTRGSEVAIALDDGTEHIAFVRAIVPQENPTTRTRPVRFAPQFNGILRPLAANQSVTVMLPLGGVRQVVSVHKDAVLNRQGKQVVFVVEEQQAQARDVQLGQPVGGRFEVLNGVSPGDLVVVRGNERLRPGQKVRYEGSS